jgi:hypothetical protein
MLNRVIPWKTEVKYLGIKFDNHLRFNAQVEHAKSRDQTVRGKLNSLVCRQDDEQNNDLSNDSQTGNDVRRRGLG